jgi:hypothetical protein
MRRDPAGRCGPAGVADRVYYGVPAPGGSDRASAAPAGAPSSAPSQSLAAAAPPARAAPDAGEAAAAWLMPPRPLPLAQPPWPIAGPSSYIALLVMYRNGNSVTARSTAGERMRATWPGGGRRQRRQRVGRRSGRGARASSTRPGRGPGALLPQQGVHLPWGRGSSTGVGEAALSTGRAAGVQRDGGRGKSGGCSGCKVQVSQVAVKMGQRRASLSAAASSRSAMAERGLVGRQQGIRGAVSRRGNRPPRPVRGPLWGPAAARPARALLGGRSVAARPWGGGAFATRGHAVIGSHP